MNEQETIADIIAEKRREANYIVQVSQGKCQTRRDKAEDEARDIRREADRLEAALKRELDALNEQITVLRQQSDLWSKRAAELVEKCNEQYEKLKQVGNAAKLREACANIAEYARSAMCHTTDAHLLGYLNQIEGWAKVALDAPPRNCDRFECATTKAAADVWRKEDGGKTAYHEWLLAPATEKEGGNDANE